MPRLATLLAARPAPARLPRGRLPLDAAGWPSGACWPAGTRAAFVFAFAAGPSVLGGSDEFEESRPACRRSASSSTRNASINIACSATIAANSAYEGGSDTAGSQT